MEEQKLQEQIQQPTSNNSYIKPKPKIYFVASLGSLFFLMTGALIFLGYRNYLLKREVTNLQREIASKPSPSPSPSSTTGWVQYKSDKFGFTIRYPEALEVEAKEVDIKADYKKYVEKCKTGVSGGCGGGRWPDFKISFLRPSGKAAFDVDIYQLPVKEYFGGIERDNFTYLVGAGRYSGEDIELDPVDSKTLDAIALTLDFFEPKQPLACLWSTELGPGFNPEEDKDYIKEHSSQLVKLSGFYFNSSRNSCQNITFYTWKGQEETDKPPFSDLKGCTSSCGSGF